MNNPTTLVDPLGLGPQQQTCGAPGTTVPQDYSPSVYCYSHMGIGGGSGPAAFFSNTADEFDLIWAAGFYGGGNGVAGEFGEGFDPNGAMLVNLMEDSSLPGIGNSGTASAPSNTAVAQNACTAPVLGAVNNQFGTSAAPGDVQGDPFPNGQATNFNIALTGLPTEQFNSIQTGRYPLNWWTYIIGYGPTLHVTGTTHWDPLPAAFQSSNIGGLTSVTFTAHIDYGYLFNPFGALYHLFRELLHIGGPRKPC